MDMSFQFHQIVSLTSKSSVYILGNSLLPDVSFVNIFSHSGLYSFDVFYRAEVNFSEVSSSILSWIMPLMVTVKTRHHTQEHLKFSPSIVSEFDIVLCFTFKCNPFRVNFCKGCKGSV